MDLAVRLQPPPTLAQAHVERRRHSLRWPTRQELCKASGFDKGAFWGVGRVESHRENGCKW